MISSVDFEDLFPALFRPYPLQAASQMAMTPNPECIARWEDDGGRGLPEYRFDTVETDQDCREVDGARTGRFVMVSTISRGPRYFSV